ncbi:MAG TPA: hypothetical protein VHR86_09375, partial [Armatimonadota bacterium]|nr:hypothetical protein [Armatimonadota bacterium]
VSTVTWPLGIRPLSLMALPDPKRPLRDARPFRADCPARRAVADGCRANSPILVRPGPLRLVSLMDPMSRVACGAARVGVRFPVVGVVRR